MSSIITELQQDAVNNEVDLTNLLRKALVVAKKLKAADFEKWIQNELNGYRKDKIPSYRLLPCEPRLYHHQSGWVPIIMEDPKETELLSVWPCFNPVAELKALASGAQAHPHFQAPYPPTVERDLLRLVNYPSRPMCYIAKLSVIGILDKVRNTLLNTAIDLDKDGIKGESYSFSEEETKKASKNILTVNNFYKDINESNIQINSDGSTQTYNAKTNTDEIKDFVKEAKKYLGQIEIDKKQKTEFAKRLEILEVQLASDKPRRKVIQEALKSCRSILEGTAGSIIASGLLYKLGLFLPK